MTHQDETEPGLVGYLLILVIFIGMAGPALADLPVFLNILER
jgi:hypothetical protein